MQPLRSHHRIERTAQGEGAWRLQALSPPDRTLLGSLRTPQSVSDLLRLTSFSTSDLEGTVLRMARLGWVLIHEPSSGLQADQAQEPVIHQEEAENASDLEDILRRHRIERSAEMEGRSSSTPFLDNSSPARHDMAHEHSSHQGDGLIGEKAATPQTYIEHDPSDFLPFDFQQAKSDGLLEALRHPNEAASIQDSRPEWAPPSGGLAALLRALGEPVPEGVSLSPDQEEHLEELEPVEPWGGSFSKSNPPAPEENQEDPSFRRLRDQPSQETKPRPNMGILRGSLNKVQQERAADEAVRERARQLRQRQEDERKQVNDKSIVNREKEEKSRQGTTLLGLSQRLARVKSDRNKED